MLGKERMDREITMTVLVLSTVTIATILVLVLVISPSLMTYAIVQTLDLVGPDEKKKAIDDCMVSLKAQNPREEHLLDCDIYMPLVPRFIENQLIYNTTDIDKKFDEYMALRALDIPTDEEIKQQVINGQLNLTQILTVVLLGEN
jgi:hypothetical protein